MLKKSIGIGLLCLTGQAYANLTVTTTQDIVADDKECSLREAVAYIEKYQTAPEGETEAQKQIREEAAKKGYMGCANEASTNVIYLEKDKEYTLNKEIEITAGLTVTTFSDQFGSDDSETGLHNATIKTNGAHRLFIIDDKKSEIAQINVNLTQLNLKGCGTSNICADRGGVIFNRESLTLDYVKLTDGYANEGGAIYNEGLIAGMNTVSTGLLQISNSIFINNKARTGAVVFMGQPLFSISHSIFRDNEATNTNGMLIYSEVAFDSATTSTETFSRVSVLKNSVLFKNKGYLLNLRDGVYVNNVTAVDNDKGIYFHAPTAKAHISNSILAGNNNQDCTYAANDRSLALNNLVGSSCKAGETNNLNLYLGTQQLFAGNVTESDTCARPPAKGLLCPFTTPEKSFLGFFKPRLLSSYTILNDSPIVNRGRMYSDGSYTGLAACETNDIRGLARGESVHCDLGSFELMISPDSVSRVGQDILYGQKATMNIINSLGDGELLPAAECSKVTGKATAPDGSAWQVGCARVEQAVVTPQSKGKTILDEQGVMTYQPNSNWHGLDEFNVRVITTTSRFSEAERDRDVVVPVRIVQSPPKDFTSDTIDVKGTSGGAFGLYGFLGLITLGLLRRKLK